MERIKMSMRYKVVLVVAVVFALAGIGFGAAAEASSPSSTFTPQSGTVSFMNPSEPGLDNMTSEGSLRESNGTVIPVGFWVSGVLLHIGEKVCYVEVPIRVGGVGYSATVITTPTNPSATFGNGPQC